MTLRLTEALKVVGGAVRARELEMRITVTVCDAAGRLIALHCMAEHRICNAAVLDHAPNRGESCVCLGQSITFFAG